MDGDRAGRCRPSDCPIDPRTPSLVVASAAAGDLD